MDNNKISGDVKQNPDDLMPPVTNPEKVKNENVDETVTEKNR